MLRDGQSVIRAAWGTPIPVDPGAHAIEVRAPGKRPRRLDLVVEASGAPQTVAIAPLESEPVAVDEPVASATPAAPTPAPEPAPPVETSSAQKAVGWTLGGVGLAVGGRASSSR